MELKFYKQRYLTLIPTILIGKFDGYMNVTSYHWISFQFLNFCIQLTFKL